MAILLMLIRSSFSRSPGTDPTLARRRETENKKKKKKKKTLNKIQVMKLLVDDKQSELERADDRTLPQKQPVRG
ncbi:hypothetical protein YC2023_017136 [Brassica napus]